MFLKKCKKSQRFKLIKEGNLLKIYKSLGRILVIKGKKKNAKYFEFINNILKFYEIH